LRPAHRHLAPAYFDLAKRITRTKSATEAFECTRRFWEIFFKNAERPILWEMFRKPDDRVTGYYPLLLQLDLTPESRPRQHEVLIESYRKGKIDEAYRAFKKIYLEMIDDVLDRLEPQESEAPND
jgi:DNA-binding GntR family transcriptional regulator